jgi:cytochrome c-type biogenesis protein
MESNIFPLISATWLGILTSISPCPLATNIIAITYIGKQIKKTYGPLLSGGFYTIGRAFAYIIISFIIISSLFSVPEISLFLQENMNKILGPFLIIAGLFILEILYFKFGNFSFINKFEKHLGNAGILGAFFLGFIFALSFCPVSAALFFGSVIPLSLKYESKFLLPLFYGIGTALPVLFFSLIISYSSHFAGRFFNKLSIIELWLRRITGLLFLIIGVYFCIKYIFKISIIF